MSTPNTVEELTPTAASTLLGFYLLGEAIKACKEINPKFLSGNEVAVTQATITAEEWAPIKAYLDHLNERSKGRLQAKTEGEPK